MLPWVDSVVVSSRFTLLSNSIRLMPGEYLKQILTNRGDQLIITVADSKLLRSLSNAMLGDCVCARSDVRCQHFSPIYRCQPWQVSGHAE